MRPNRIVLAAASLLLVVGSAHAQREDRARPTGSSRTYGRAPDVEVWIHSYVFISGDRIRPYFESEPGAYITILRVTTTGDVRVLYPRRPTVQQAYRDRLPNDEVPYSTRPEFYLNEPEGVGFVFALASFEPFDYTAFNRGGQWSMLQLAGSTRYADPYRAVSYFAARTLSLRTEYSTDYIQYEVISGGRYQRYGYGYAYGSGYGQHDAWYNQQYSRCLDYYGLQTIAYCRSYAGSGIGNFPYIVARPPQQSPAPSTPAGGRRMKFPPPDTVIGDPAVVGEAPTSTGSSPSRYYDLRERSSLPASERSSSPVRKGSSSPRVIENGDDSRIERRQKPEPIRSEPAPYVIAQPQREPAPAQRYEPAPMRRQEPAPVQRSEPQPAPRVETPRVEQRQEPRAERAPPREHPTPHVDPAPPPAPPPAT
jgi:hypothetical protein